MGYYKDYSDLKVQATWGVDIQSNHLTVFFGLSHQNAYYEKTLTRKFMENKLVTNERFRRYMMANFLDPIIEQVAAQVILKKISTVSALYITILL